MKKLKKIVFFSNYGYQINNSTGGQILRVKSSINALSKICELILVSGNFKLSGFNNKKIFKNKVYELPSIKNKIISYKYVKGIVWRIKKFWYKKNDAKFIVNLCRKKKIDCIWFSYASENFHLIQEIKKIDKKLKIIADTDSVYHIFLKRRIKYEKYLSKFILWLIYLKYKKIETRLLKISDYITAVSEYDKKIFKKLCKKSKILIFRNVVSSKKFIKRKKTANFNILLSGTFGGKTSPMNVSTRWFLNEIYPIIEKKIKNLKLTIIGMNSDKEFYNYASNQLIIKGWVKSVSKFFKHSDLAIVPLKFESGTRFKILEAGVNSLPVISTSLGAEGLGYKKNFNIVIEDDAKKFANEIINLSNNKKLRNFLAKNLYNLVIKEYTINSLIKDARKIIQKISI